jgi:hypothetical protein
VDRAIAAGLPFATEQDLAWIDLDKYQGWLTAANKTADIATQSPLDLKPMMVLVEDKQNDIKQDPYGEVPMGGKIRVFGTAPEFDENPAHFTAGEKG